ncbi:hypothetical protein BGZ73_009174 [Actinomortierella ambigua]|nr:hypothetical protein BGZ73_009174 [Actinomortierella ambigua]
MVEATALVRSAPWACTRCLRVLALSIIIVNQATIETQAEARTADVDLYSMKPSSGQYWFVRQFAQPRQGTKQRLKIQECPSHLFLRLNRAVFTMLSRMTMLDTLDISVPKSAWVPTQDTLSLSFEGGLGKLGQLVRLRRFGCYYYPESKMPRKYEYLWMVKRWPVLQSLGLEERAVFQFESPFIFVKDWIPTARTMPWAIEADHSAGLPYEVEKW